MTHHPNNPAPRDPSPEHFDPGAAAHPDAGIFGLNTQPENAAVRILPVPYDATTSYTPGTANAPDAIARASHQLDLHDHHFADAWTHGIHLDPEPPNIRKLSQATRLICEHVFQSGNDATATEKHKIDAAGQRVFDTVKHWATQILKQNKIPAVLGGDHSTPLGNIVATAQHFEAQKQPLALLQLDAHMDLRNAYAGMRYSHASVIHNTIIKAQHIHPIVQVAIRDYATAETDAAHHANAKRPNHIITHFAEDLANHQDATNESFRSIARRILEPLPENIYITFDIDALEPHLCPNTGTPVPAGLSFDQARILIEETVAAGKRIAAFDLVEVAPSTHSPINEIVGMRILAKLAYAAIRSQH